jgi:23S rRNA (guanosine2251-2'-O)-methyltransferase
MKNTRISTPLERLEPLIIYGINPLWERIRQGGQGINEIIVADGRKGTTVDNILSWASVKGIPVTCKDKSYLDQVSGSSAHQGVAAFCASYAYVNIDELIANSTQANIILMLDGITDPHNLGALIRTAYCLGVKGVIIPENRAAAVTAMVIKASAGAAHWLPVTREVNLTRTIDYLKERGFWIYGADADQGTDVNQFADAGPVCLVMGSEGSGIRPLIRKKCDFLLAIPMAGKLHSLNVSVAAGIILYEIARKQGRKN